MVGDGKHAGHNGYQCGQQLEYGQGIGGNRGQPADRAGGGSLVLAGLLILAASVLFHVQQRIPLQQPAALGHGSALVAAVAPRLEGQL